MGDGRLEEERTHDQRQMHGYDLYITNSIVYDGQTVKHEFKTQTWPTESFTLNNDIRIDDILRSLSHTLGLLCRTRCKTPLPTRHPSRQMRCVRLPACVSL